MAKKGMARPERTHPQPHNTVPPVPVIQGKAKSGKKPAAPIIPGTRSPVQKVYHQNPFPEEKPVSSAYGAIDNDLAVENLENDLTAADRQDV